MSTNEAAERLRHWISEEVDPTAPLKDAYTLLEAALAHERSAGTAPLDVKVLAQVLYELGVDDLPLEQALELAGQIVARLAEGTD